MNNANRELEARALSKQINAMATEDLTLAEQCTQLGELLGLGRPVSERILTAAVQDSNYAMNLLVCRNAPGLLATLLNNPPERPGTELSMTELLKNGAKALLRWSGAGFTTVDDATLRHRLAACDACPNLSHPPEGRALLYSLAGTAAGSKSICRLCGCPVTRKANMATESCPDAHPQIPGITRWEEALKTVD